MRNSRAKKEENRRLILGEAGRLFRERGITGVSVADVMQAADMTHGGFYRHFTDKDDLVVQTLNCVLGIDDAAENGEAPVELDLGVYAKEYLSLQHRDDPGAGCAFAALGAEAGRGSEAGREAMTTAMHRQIGLFGRHFDRDNEAARRQYAIGFWASMIGAMVLSRASTDPKLAHEILDGTLGWLSDQKQVFSESHPHGPSQSSSDKRAPSSSVPIKPGL